MIILDIWNIAFRDNHICLMLMSHCCMQLMYAFGYHICVDLFCVGDLTSVQFSWAVDLDRVSVHSALLHGKSHVILMPLTRDLRTLVISLNVSYWLLIYREVLNYSVNQFINQWFSTVFSQERIKNSLFQNYFFNYLISRSLDSTWLLYTSPIWVRYCCYKSTRLYGTIFHMRPHLNFEWAILLFIRARHKTM